MAHKSFFELHIQFKGNEEARYDVMVDTLVAVLIERGRKGFSRYETPSDYSNEEAVFLKHRLEELGVPKVLVKYDSNRSFYSLIIIWDKEL
jgi:hypothetical protein